MLNVGAKLAFTSADIDKRKNLTVDKILYWVSINKPLTKFIYHHEVPGHLITDWSIFNDFPHLTIQQMKKKPLDTQLIQTMFKK